MGGKTRIKDMGNNKNINIRNEDSEDVFRKLNIDPNKSYLMDLKNAIFLFYNLPKPEFIIRDPRKTLAEQNPDNAYGIPITDRELKLFMDLFDLTENDWFQENIGGRITRDLLLK